MYAFLCSLLPSSSFPCIRKIRAIKSVIDKNPTLGCLFLTTHTQSQLVNTLRQICAKRNWFYSFTSSVAMALLHFISFLVGKKEEIRFQFWFASILLSWLYAFEVNKDDYSTTFWTIFFRWMISFLFFMFMFVRLEFYEDMLMVYCNFNWKPVFSFLSVRLHRLYYSFFLCSVVCNAEWSSIKCASFRLKLNYCPTESYICSKLCILHWLIDDFVDCCHIFCDHFFLVHA